MPEYGGNILCEQGFRNVSIDGETVGFQVRVYISYYRGIPFSLIGGFEVEVDGQVFPPQAIGFSVDGQRFYPLDVLGSHVDDVWEFGVKAYLRVRHPGGLSRGAHTVRVTQRVDVPYLPFTTQNSQTKRLTLADGGTGKIKLGVSLYSYQVEYLLGQMNLEECIEAVADMGADGVEILPQSMIPDCFHLGEDFLRKWFGWMEKYGTQSVALDAFCDENKLYRKLGRGPTFEESVTMQKKYIDLAHRLGCKYIRAQIVSPLFETSKILDVLAPYAAEHDVRLGREIHAPLSIRSKPVDEILEYVAKTGTKHVGLLPDFGIWQLTAPNVILDMHVRDGAHADLVEYAKEQHRLGTQPEEVYAAIQTKGGNPHDLSAARRICTNHYDNPEDLRAIVPYIVGVHGKFWGVDENLREDCIDYENPLRILVEEGYEGYINSEYEGNRHTQDLGPVCGVEQVRRHHAMIRNILDKYEAH